MLREEYGAGEDEANGQYYDQEPPIEAESMLGIWLIHDVLLLHVRKNSRRMAIRVGAGHA
jgi:hypothetical protein